MNEHEPWNFWVLGALRAARPTRLKDVYVDIDGLRGTGGINLQSFKVDGRWGPRPNYTHIVRSTMSILKRRGLVEHLGKGRTGVYRITSAGLEELHRIEP